MTATDAGLGFWLRYVEASGGLSEASGDSTLVMLPAALQSSFALPEDLRVTADPDVAREDGATLLSAGHPALSLAADEVLALGDVAALVVPVPAATPPAAEYLQAAAREQFTIEHGRIDATGAPTRSVRTVLRVGALVDYTLSSDDHYQECAECWVDVPSLRALPAAISERLAAAPTQSKDGAPSMLKLVAAVKCADRIIHRSAERRRTELGRDVHKARDAELTRVEAYYSDALATVERRRAQASPDRRELLDARAESVRTEHARRIDETREKYQPSHQVRPYRMHLYEVPAWRLPVDVRRGDRRYALTLDWLIPLNRFADLACPHCSGDERLVATKTRLGCTGCVPRPVVESVPEPMKPRAKSAANTKQAVSPPVAAPPVRNPATPERMPVGTERSRASVHPGKVGDRLARDVWDAVGRNDRRLARLCAPDSPAAAAIRLYGPSGAAVATGIPSTERLVAFTATTTIAPSGIRHACSGTVETATGRRFPFVLRWQESGSGGQLDEILPYDRPWNPARLSGFVLSPGRFGVYAPPRPRVRFCPVGELLWAQVIPAYGLPVTLRCLAALWRLPDVGVLSDAHGPGVIAADIERVVCQRANVTNGRFAEAAARYRVPEVGVRAADVVLRKLLGLGPQRWW